MSHIYLANALDTLAPPKSKTTSGKQVFTLTRFDIVGETLLFGFVAEGENLG